MAEQDRRRGAPAAGGVVRDRANADRPGAGLFAIRDPEGYPVLYSAIVRLADVLVTGDKDFGDVRVESPEILSPAEYAAAYVE